MGGEVFYPFKKDFVHCALCPVHCTLHCWKVTVPSSLCCAHNKTWVSPHAFSLCTVTLWLGDPSRAPPSSSPSKPFEKSESEKSESEKKIGWWQGQQYGTDVFLHSRLIVLITITIKILVFHIRNQKSYIIDDDKENDGACYKCFWKTVVCPMVAGGKPSRPDDIDT